VKQVLTIAAVIAVFGAVGEMDYRDELKQEKQYRTMVCEGTWPNYKDLDVDCNGYQQHSGKAHSLAQWGQ